MKSKKVSIALDSGGSEGGSRTLISQTLRGRVRAPKWLVSGAIFALIVLSFYHWQALRNHGTFSTTFQTRSRSRDVNLPEGDSVDTRKTLLSQAADIRAERMRSRLDQQRKEELTKEEAILERLKGDEEVDLTSPPSETKEAKLTPAQKSALDAVMDDMSDTKRQLMYWLFQKFVLPATPEALEVTYKAHDPQARPGYFRPGNWDWTMTKAGQYDPELYSPPTGELPKQRLPQAIMIGSGHCGTRALLDFLQMHPHVVVAHSEVHYFDDNFHRGLDWYRGQMPLSYSNQITLEKSPSYVMVPQAAREVYAMNKDVKLLMVVKDPVVTLMSAFSRRVPIENAPIQYTFLRTENGKRSVNSELYSVVRGMYSVHLKHWLKYFPLSQLHVLDGGALVKDPITQIQAVERFLGVPARLDENNFVFNKTKGFYCMKPFTMRMPKCLGKNKGKPHVTLDPEVKKLLYDFYRPYNLELFQLLGKSFDWEPKDSV